MRALQRWLWRKWMGLKFGAPMCRCGCFKEPGFSGWVCLYCAQANDDKRAVQREARRAWNDNLMGGV